jgi:hypothetical protein
MPRQVLSPRVEVAPVVAQPPDGDGSAEEDDGGPEAQETPGGLPPAPRSKDGEPRHVAEPGRREPI